MTRRHVTVRLSPQEVSLVLDGLAALDKDDRFTRSVQPAHSEDAVAAATREQAIVMLRAIFEQAR